LQAQIPPAGTNSPAAQPLYRALGYLPTRHWTFAALLNRIVRGSERECLRKAYSPFITILRSAANLHGTFATDPERCPTVEAMTKVRDGEDKLEYHELLRLTGKKKLGVAITADGKINKAEDKSPEKDE
jgi:hypothetical protein